MKIQVRGGFVQLAAALLLAGALLKAGWMGAMPPGHGEQLCAIMKDGQFHKNNL